MKSDLNDLKKANHGTYEKWQRQDVQKDNEGLIQKIYGEPEKR